MQTLTTSDLTKARKVITDFRDSLASGEASGIARLSNEADPFISRKQLVDIPEVAQFEETVASLQAASAGTDAALLRAKAENLLLLLQLIEIKMKTTDLPETLHTNAEFELIEENLHKQTLELDSYRNKTKEELTAIFRQAPVGICILKGEDLVVDIANPVYLRLVDKDETLVGKQLTEAIPELKGHALETILKNVLRTGKPYVGNEVPVHLNRNGEAQLAYFNFVYQPLLETDGSISGVISVSTEVTEIIKAKTAFLEKEKEFRTLVMQSPIAMTIFRGHDLAIDIANHSMLEHLWRKEEAEVIGKPLLEVFPELHGQGYIEKLYGVMETGEAYRDKESMAFVDSHDGRRIFYLDYEYAPLYDINGHVSGIMCTVNDVTDKVNARKIQETVRNRYTHLIETLPVAMYTVDSNGYIDLFNKAAATLWGRRPELGKDRWCGAYKLFSLSGDPIDKEECPMAYAFRGGRALEEEIYMEREDGERRHVIVYPRALSDEEGNIIAASKVMIDITDRKNAEEALTQSEEKFRVLTDTIPQLIWTGTPDGQLDYFSDSVYKYAGLSPAEIAQNGWLSIVHPDDRAENMEKWTHSIKTGADFFLEHRFRRYDGMYRWQLSRAVPLMDEAGNILQWVGTSTDIDDQKNFQQNLEKLVEERTIDLQKANIDLENMNRELSSFAYISSHDLQEPLRKIQTFVSIILNTDHENLSEIGKRNFARMQLAANRMKALINDLLTYSRANAAEKVFEATDLNTIISEISGELAEVFEAKGGVLKVAEIPLISAIPFQLRQLFVNLLSNAIKFSSNDVIPVISIDSEIVKGKTVGNSNLFKEDDYLHITVTDNGIGFNQEYAEKIFEVFQRLHSKGEYEGTGIGLAICNKIVENHSGLIRAESEPGKGATFHIYLPFIPAE